MSEETKAPKITTIKMEKDPKRVEAGKRLAAISKAAKERKMREKIESESKQENDSSGDYNVNYGLVFGIFGTGASIGSFYYIRKEYKRETKKLETIKEELESKHAEIKRSDYRSSENSLDSLE